MQSIELRKESEACERRSQMWHACQAQPSVKRYLKRMKLWRESYAKILSVTVQCTCLSMHNKHSTAIWWSGVVGVAGTQHRALANERPQQAAYGSNKNSFCRPNQHKTSTNPTDTHSQTYTVRAGRKESKQTVQLNRSSEQPNQQFVCFLGLLQL